MIIYFWLFIQIYNAALHLYNNLNCYLFLMIILFVIRFLYQARYFDLFFYIFADLTFCLYVSL